MVCLVKMGADTKEISLIKWSSTNFLLFSLRTVKRVCLFSKNSRVLHYSFFFN